MVDKYVWVSQFGTQFLVCCPLGCGATMTPFDQKTYLSECGYVSICPQCSQAIETVHRGRISDYVDRHNIKLKWVTLQQSKNTTIPIKNNCQLPNRVQLREVPLREAPLRKVPEESYPAHLHQIFYDMV